MTPSREQPRAHRLMLGDHSKVSSHGCVEDHRVRILVTGGAGFIGSHYVRTLLTGGYAGFEDARVTVFDKLTYAGNLDNLAPFADDPRLPSSSKATSATGSCSLEFLPGHDAVVNFAAETHVDRSIVGAADFVVTNVLGAQTLFDACLRAGVPASCTSAPTRSTGRSTTGSWTEADAAAAELSVLRRQGRCRAPRARIRPTYGLDISTTRCSNNYGPYQFPEKVIPLFVTNLIDGKQVPLYGDGLNVRDWLFVDDHCRGIQLVLERGSRASPTTSAAASS